MPKISDRKRLESFIKSRRVVELKNLFQVIQTTSRMTVFRRLSEIEYLCSYSHAGRYYTHRGIPQFNRDGLWFYDDIGFSKNGSLKKTLIFLVHNSDAGKFHVDLERQLRIRVHNALLDLVKSRQIDRMKHEGRYLYLSIDEPQRKEQVERRDNLAAKIRRISGVISEPLVIEVLAEVIRQSERHPRTDQVASSLVGKGLAITEKDVADVFDYYGIEKKTLDSR